MKFLAAIAVLLSYSGPVLAQGTVHTDSFESSALGVTKIYRVYLPEGYNENDTRYPVIYALHGWGVTEDSWIELLDLPEVADSMGLQAIVVMPDGDRSLYVNAASSVDYEECLRGEEPLKNKSEPRDEFCVQTPNYEDYIVDDLVKEIDSNFRTVATREARAVSGDSAGGFGAMSLAIRNPDIYSSAASHSGFLAQLYDGPYPYVSGQAQFLTSIDPETTYGDILSNLGPNIANWRNHDPYSLMAAKPRHDIALYFDCGKEDQFGFLELNLVFDDLLTSLNIDHEFHSPPGQHDDEFFGERIRYSLQFQVSHFMFEGVYPPSEVGIHMK